MSGDAECHHCGRRGAEAFSGPGIHARAGTPLCHPSDASLPDCYRRVSVWAEPVGALLYDGPKPAGVEAIVSAEEHARAYLAWRASLPHGPVWNLIPRRRGMGDWECSWHGTVTGDRCGECHREHAEYQATGTWEDRRPVPSPQEVAAPESWCPCGHGSDDLCLNGLIYGSCGDENCGGGCDGDAGTCRSLPGCCDTGR